MSKRLTAHEKATRLLARLKPNGSGTMVALATLEALVENQRINEEIKRGMRRGELRVVVQRRMPS